jgi:hypothetical protein
MQRHGDYGYDAPYALIMFGALSAAGGLGAVNVPAAAPGMAILVGQPDRGDYSRHRIQGS